MEPSEELIGAVRKEMNSLYAFYDDPAAAENSLIALAEILDQPVDFVWRGTELQSLQTALEVARAYFPEAAKSDYPTDVLQGLPLPCLPPSS
jgi:hypothetical protein